MVLNRGLELFLASLDHFSKFLTIWENFEIFEKVTDRQTIWLNLAISLYFSNIDELIKSSHKYTIEIDKKNWNISHPIPIKKRHFRT